MVHKEVNSEYEKKGFSLLFIALAGYGVYWAFFDMNRLPTEEYFTEETSLDGKYTVKAYAMEVLQRLMLFVVS